MINRHIPWLLAGSILSTAVQANAQTVPADPPADAADNESIVVTGSRTIRNGDNSPTPVTSVMVDQLTAARPTTVFVNVTNVFDTKAPVAASYPLSTSPGIAGGFVLGDDPIGRYFRFGVKMKF